MGRHAQGISVPASTVVSNGVARTPSTTRDTLVTVILDYNTLAAVTSRTIDLEVGATVVGTIAAFRNADAVSARRFAQTVTFLVPVNTSYELTASDATNLAMTAWETLL